jgi:hypothetical protein
MRLFFHLHSLRHVSVIEVGLEVLALFGFDVMGLLGYVESLRL